MNGVDVSRRLVVTVVVALSGLGVLATTSVSPSVAAADRVPTGDGFYAPPKPLAKAKPGTIIRSTPIADAPAGARAWKILYHSRAVDGKDIAVSGVVVAPAGKAPRGGRVVVTWAAAVAAADQCAPSKQPDIASGTSGAGIGLPTRSSRCCRHSSTRAMWWPRPTTRGSARPAHTQRSSARAWGEVCSTRPARGTRREGCRRRAQGARLRALGGRPRGAVRR